MLTLTLTASCDVPLVLVSSLKDSLHNRLNQARDLHIQLPFTRTFVEKIATTAGK